MSCGRWPLDLFTNFHWQYFWMLAVCAVVLAGLPAPHRPTWWQHALIVTFAVANLAVVLPAWVPPGHPAMSATPPTPSASLKLLSLNVHYRNDQYAKVLAAIRANNADLVLLMEVNAAWLTGLAELDRDYPYRIIAPQEDSFGIALYSRLPLRGSIETSATAGVPFIDAYLSIAETNVRFLGIHTLPPVNREYALSRDDQTARNCRAGRR